MSEGRSAARERFKLKADTSERRSELQFIEYTAKVVRSWPSWMQGECAETDEAINVQMSGKGMETVPEPDTLTDSSFAGIPVLVDDQAPSGTAYLLASSAFFQVEDTLCMKHPDGRWKPLLTFPKVTIKLTWNP